MPILAMAITSEVERRATLVTITGGIGIIGLTGSDPCDVPSPRMALSHSMAAIFFSFLFSNNKKSPSCMDFSTA